MPFLFCKIPIAINRRRIRIISVKYPIRNSRHPNISGIRFPVFHLFRATDDCSKRLYRPVNNPVFSGSSMNGIHILPINSRHNEHFISEHRNPGCVINSFEWSFLGSIAITSGLYINVNLHWVTLLFIFNSFLPQDLSTSSSMYPQTLPDFPAEQYAPSLRSTAFPSVVL